MIKLLYPKFWQRRNIISYLLLPFSVIYLLLGYIRNLLASPIRFPAKVICIGNVTVGGTGKTQIVIHIAQILKQQNIKFVIISKAYGSTLKKAVIVDENHTAKEVGDESVILREYSEVIATKKISHITQLINKIKPQIIIVDDYLQNPGFHKDQVILTVDSTRLFGNGFLIPAGPLRQYPDKALKKADLIICIDSNKNKIADIIKFYKDKLLIAQIIPSNKIDKSKNYYAFCGIGNPERFFATLKNYGLKLSGYEIFPDHHYYSDQDLKMLHKKASEMDAILITTKKDYVKLQGKAADIVCCEVELLIENQQKLLDLLYEKN